MKTCLQLLNQKPIAYYPIYRQITGSTTGAILLSQLMYWFSKKEKFFKTNDELLEETMLTDKELKTAKSAIKKLPFIKITLEGLPAKTFYKIDWDLYVDTLENYGRNAQEKSGPTSWAESDQQYGPNRTNSMGQIGPTLIGTENTTENTSKNIKKKETKKKDFFSSLLEDKKILNSLENLEVDGEFLSSVFEYRKKLGKPLKTERMVNSLLNNILKCKKELGMNAQEVFDVMQDKGWISVKPEWISRDRGIIPNKQNKPSALDKGIEMYEKYKHNGDSLLDAF